MPADVPILMPEDVRWLDGTGAARDEQEVILITSAGAFFVSAS